MNDEFQMVGETGRWFTVGVPSRDLLLPLVTATEPVYDDATRVSLAGTLGTETRYTFRTADCGATVAAPRVPTWRGATDGVVTASHVIEGR